MLEITHRMILFICAIVYLVAERLGSGYGWVALPEDVHDVWLTQESDHFVVVGRRDFKDAGRQARGAGPGRRSWSLITSHSSKQQEGAYSALYQSKIAQLRKLD